MDETGNILDGHHRVQAWQELRDEGVTLPDYPRMVRSGMTEEAKRNHARRLNVMRRQLSREQRDEVMRAMRADGMSQRQIAQAVGVSQKTVSNALTCSGDEFSSPDQVIGADGKSYPAERNLVEQRNEIIRAMRADGMSQRQIAQAVGVSQKTVSNVLALVGDENSSPTNLIEGADGKFRPSAYAPRAEPPPSLFVPGGAVTLDPVAVSTAVESARLEVAQRRAEREQVREERRQANAEVAAATLDPIKAGARFATILIDPPWDWGDEGDVNQLGRAKPDYATMPFDELLRLPVGNLADVDCHLYLWITNRSLPKGFGLMEAWGFRYVTCVTWAKPSFGMGNYFRGQTEHLLFGVKGSQPLRRKDAGTVFYARRGDGGHSSKPIEAYELIESCSPGPYLEMFARRQRDGWTAWGADA
jgi:N6-adenosine-specific RNA methylase IME4/transposase